MLGSDQASLLCKVISKRHTSKAARPEALHPGAFLAESGSKGTFHAKMGSIKNRNGMDLTEAEDIEKRWQEYTEELYKKKKIFMTKIITMV